MKLMFQKILISNIVFVTLLYIFLFIVNPELGNYFLNNNLIENYFPNSNIAYYVPVSDDLYLYLDGIKDFSSIIEYDYNYQNRPLYIASIKFFYFILEKLSFDGLILNFLSFLFFHTLVVTISVVMFVKSISFSRNINRFHVISFISILFILNPIIKYGLFDSAHQTILLLQFAASLYLIQKDINKWNTVYKISFIIGIMALANSVFFLTWIFLILPKIKNLFKSSNFGKLLISFIVTLIPVLLWNLYIYSEGYIPYNAEIIYWRQFIWIPLYILNGYENINFDLDRYEYYCMSVPLFLECYMYQLLDVIKYLILPILLAIFNTLLLIKNQNEKFKKLLKNLSAIFITTLIFWGFIGWYPPLRIGLYSVGFFITFLLAIQFALLENSKLFYVGLVLSILYYLYLPHWNNPNIINLNFGFLLSLFLFLVYMIFYLFEKKKILN